MYPIPENEHLVELRTCRQCSAEFPITDKDLEFYEKVSPTFPVSPLCKEGSEWNEWGDLPPFAKGGRGDFVSETTEKNPPPLLSAPPLQRRFTIPPPTLCPDCRQQRRLSFRNERKLYKRKCDATGKDIVSIYSPDKPYTVYHQDYWWSDKWDPMSYGRKFDFERGAFEQFGELLKEVPRFSLANLSTTLENAEYTNHFASSKNCFMCFNGSNNKDSLYCDWFGENMNCVDSSILMRSSYCYESTLIEECAHCSYIESSKNCSNWSYLYSCIWCRECFMCSNLSNKSYYINNTSFSREEYHDEIKRILGKYRRNELIDQFGILKSSSIRRCTTNPHSESILWDRMSYSQNTYWFDWQNIRDSKYVYSIWDTVSSIDCYELAAWSKYCLESMSADTILQCNFSLNGANNTSVHYSDMCFSSSHLFLCIWLRNKSYCILNKQYTKEEYEILVPKIIEKMMKTPLKGGDVPTKVGTEGVALRTTKTTPLTSPLSGGSPTEWWEFFPASMSPFGYNETVAQEYFPLSREEVLGSHPEFISGSSFFVAQWEDAETSSAWPNTFLHWPLFNWSDYETPFPQVEKVIPASKLPDTIEKIPDDILNWAIECEVSGKPFRIIRQELEFYRKYNIPIPRRHPDVRHMDRMKMRNPRKLFERLCDCEQCEENWRQKWVILKEGEGAGMYENSTNIKNSPLSFSERESDPERSSAIAKDDKKRNITVHTLNTDLWIHPRTWILRKKMITTYAPEGPETVYCQSCFDREVLS